MQARNLRVVLVAGIVVLSTALYLAPSQVNKKQAEGPEVAPAEAVGGFDADALLKSAESALDTDQKSALDLLNTALKKNGDRDTATLDQFGRLWDRVQIPAAAAIWFERKAAVQETERSYLDAAFRYFDGFKAATDSVLKQLLVEKAIANYTKVLELNPDNLNAKTDLGTCYVEGTAEPMKGIMMLREVVQKDPKHEMAQYNLGMLSVKSGQLDKAIERFKTVLEINPGRSEVHFFIGQIYEQQGNKSEALREYKLFMKESKDYEAVAQVGEVVKALEASR
jgi:tetratricopeptide (TPR) repeat protein